MTSTEARKLLPGHRVMLGGDAYDAGTVTAVNKSGLKIEWDLGYSTESSYGDQVMEYIDRAPQTVESTEQT